MAILALCFVLFIDTLSFGLVIPVFAPLFGDASSQFFAAGSSQLVRDTAYAVLVSIPMLFMMMGAPALGSLSDQYGRKPILMIGLTGILLSYVLQIYGISLASLILLFLGRALAGGMNGTEAIAQAAIADGSSVNERAKKMSYVTLAMVLGFISGPMLGGTLADSSLVSWFSYNMPFYAAILLTMFNIFILRYWFKETFKPETKKAFRFSKLLKSIVTAGFDRRVRVYAITFFSIQLCFATFFESTPLLLASVYDYQSSQIGLFMTYFGLVFSVVLLTVINVLFRFLSHHKLVLLGGCIVAASCITLAILPSSDVILWVLAFPIAAGLAVVYNVLLSLFSTAVTEEEQGWIMGGTVVIQSIAWLCTGGLIALLIRHINLLFLLLALQLVLSLGYFVIRCIKVRKQNNTEVALENNP